MPMLAMGQKTMNSGKVSEFMNHMQVSTSNDANTLLKIDSLWAAEMSLEENFTTLTKSSKLKSVSIQKSLIDTAYSYPWIAASQKWDTVPTGKIIYTYDSQFNLTNYLSLTWNATSKSWQNSIQITYIYDALNQLTSVTQQNWKNKGRGVYAWVNNTKKTWIYDSLNRKINFLSQTWNLLKVKWINSWQHDFTYDSIGNNIQTIENSWNTSTNSWVLHYKYINLFDSLKRIVLNPIQFWSDSIWVNAAQTAYNYDSSGNEISMLYQSWNNNSAVWKNAELDSMFYLKTNQIKRSVIKLWDTTYLNWYNVSQSIYDYDSLGNNTSKLNQDYDPVNFYWFNNNKNVYEYDSLKTQISNGILYWNLGAENWYSGTLTKLTLTYYDALKSSNIKPDKTILERQSTQTNLEIFPNPTVDVVNIQSNTSIKQVQVFDLLGNEVYLSQFNNLNNASLNISGLKPGIYLLNITNCDGTSVPKRIVKR
jgi:hypothetical protein